MNIQSDYIPSAQAKYIVEIAFETHNEINKKLSQEEMIIYNKIAEFLLNM